jgi:hypothetical protein
VTSRAVRTTRALAAASVSTVIAALSHVAGGGAPPGSVTLALTIALAALVCIALSSKKLSLWRLSASVALSQGGFHLLFGITGGDGISAAHTHGVSAGPASVPALAHGDGPMWLAHAVAALVTIAALAQGERVLAMILTFARMAFGALAGQRVDSLPITAPLRSLVVYADPPPAKSRIAAAGRERRRGPPSFV